MQVSDIEYQLQQMDDDGYGCAVTSTPGQGPAEPGWPTWADTPGKRERNAAYWRLHNARVRARLPEGAR